MSHLKYIQRKVREKTLTDYRDCFVCIERVLFIAPYRYKTKKVLYTIGGDGLQLLDENKTGRYKIKNKRHKE